MTKLLVFSIVALVALVVMIKLTIKQFQLLKACRYTTKDIKKTCYLLGIILSLQLVLLYLFLNINGLPGFIGIIFGERVDLLIPLVGQNAILFDVLNLISTLTIGSSVAVSITACATTASMVIKRKKQKETIRYERVDSITSYTSHIPSSYAYLQHCRLLN